MNFRARLLGSTLAIVGCGGGGESPDPDTTGTADTTGTTAPGSESSGTTVAPTDTSGSSEGGSTEGGSTESSTESSGAPESSSSDSSDSGSSSSESSTTEAMPICLEWDIVCADGIRSTCMNGEWQDLTCDEVCAPFGFTSSGCEEVGNDCVCDSFDDPTCEHAANGYCVCYQYYTGVACGQDQLTEHFAECFDGSDPSIPCFGDYYVNGQIDCDLAVDVCLN